MAAFNGKLYVTDDSGDELWEVNVTAPASSTRVGDLPSGLTSPRAMAAFNGKLYIIDDSGDELWEVNATAPASSTRVGDLPGNDKLWYGMTSHVLTLPASDPAGLVAVSENEWLLLDNPTSQADKKIYKVVLGSSWDSGATVPSVATDPRGIAVINSTTWLVLDGATDKIYKTTDGGTTWDSGVAVPSVATDPRGIAVIDSRAWLVVDNAADKVYKTADSGTTWDAGIPIPAGVNPAGLSFFGVPSKTDIIVTNYSVAYDYLLGEGVATNPETDLSQPNSDTNPHSIHFRRAYRAYHDGRALPFHEVDESGILLKFSATPGDGTVTLETDDLSGYTLNYRYQAEDVTLTDSAGVSALAGGVVTDLTNDKKYTFFLIAEEDNGTNRFYATLAVTPSSSDTTEVNGLAVVHLPDNLQAPLDEWYRGFVIEFPDSANQVPLRVESYVAEAFNPVLPTNHVLVRAPGTNKDFTGYSMREYRFFDGSQTTPYPGFAFMRFAVKYDGEIRADVQGFALEDPKYCIRELLRNQTWGAAKEPTEMMPEFHVPGTGDPQPPATVELGFSLGTATNAHAVLEEIARVRPFHLFRRPDGVHVTFPEGLDPSRSLLPALDRCASPPPTCEYLSQAERTTRLAVKFRPDPLTREFKGTLEENDGPDKAKEIELSYVYKAETARQCLWLQRKLLDLRKCVMRVAVMGGTWCAGDVVSESESLLGAEATTWRVLEAQERVGVVESLVVGRQEDGFAFEPPNNDWPFANWDKDIHTGAPATDYSKTAPPPVYDGEVLLVTHNPDTTSCDISFSWKYTEPLENVSGVQIEAVTGQTPEVFTIRREVQRGEGVTTGTTTIEVLECEVDATVRIYSLSPNNNLRGFPIELNAALASRFIHVATSSSTLTSEPSITSTSFTSGSSRTFYVKLPVAPTANVTVTIAKTGSVSISKTTMTFTPTTWGTAQSVVLTGSAGSGTVTFSTGSSGSDTNYRDKTTSVSVSISQYVAPLPPKLPKPRNVRIADEPFYRVIGRWDPVPNATSYTYYITRPAEQGPPLSETLPAGPAETLGRLLSGGDPPSPGTYTLRVKATAPGYLDSNWGSAVPYIVS